MEKNEYIKPEVSFVYLKHFMEGEISGGGWGASDPNTAKEGLFFDETDSAYTTDEVVVEPYEEDDDQPWSVTYHYSPWED